MGMVEGPFSKEAAASRCGCASADLCPGPLAGIDEGDKIRTISRWEGQEPDGGEDDGSDGVGWGPSSPLAICGSRGGTSLSGPGAHQVGAAQGGRHQEGLAVPGGLTGGRMVGEWQPFCSGSSTRFSLKWTGTSSSSTTSCGCFEARGQ